jgi:hypothetical protein
MKPTVDCPSCKRKIALGRATCTFCGAALPVVDGPMPAPPAGPKKYEVGNLVQVSIPPGDTGKGVFRLRLKGASMKTPALCACCLASSQVTLVAEATNIRSLPGEMMSNTYKIETRSWSFPIPYCTHCAGHGKGNLRQTTCAAAGAAVALGVIFDTRELEFAFLNREFGQKVYELNRSR